jgi:predicted transcriptional regulator
VISIIEDSNSKIKLFILKGLRSSAITKEGRNSYSIPGEGVKYMYNELVDYLANSKENMDDVYLKIEAIIKNKK